MTEEIYQKDTKENIKIFRDLEPSKEYSSYSVELNRAFGDKTYDRFQKKLLEDKKIKNNTFVQMFQKPKIKNQLTKTEEPFDLKKFSLKLKEMKQKTELAEYKLKHPREFLPVSPYKTYKESLNNSSLPKKFFKQSNPDIGRYNPNYEFLSKHSFIPFFADQNFYDWNKNNPYQSVINNKEIYEHIFDRNYNRGSNSRKNNKSVDMRVCPRFLKTDPNMNQIKNETNNTYNKSNMTVSTYNTLNNSTISSTFGDQKRNHCLKFVSYTTRKPLIKKILYNTEIEYKHPNYLSPKFLKGNINFNKYSTNTINYFDEIVKNSTNPPLGSYHPNYNSILEKTIDVYINKTNDTPLEKIKLQKLLHSYHVTTGYQMVDELNNYNNNVNLEDWDIKKEK